MIGQLGSVSVAGVGLAGKFSSIFSVIVAAVGAVAGIMIAQYIGQENRREIRRSFYLNLALAALIALLFTVLCAVFPWQVMGFYTKDTLTLSAAAEYLSVIAGTFLPAGAVTLMSALFRCMEKAKLPLYASIAAALLNTGLNYLLIFGKAGFPSMGVKGAGIATFISQLANFLIMFILLLRHGEYLRKGHSHARTLAAFSWKQYASMLLPILVCEFMWSLGENVYASIYGHLGTESSAAMTLTNPIQSLMIGALCGLSQAAGVIVGKNLGNREYDYRRRNHPKRRQNQICHGNRPCGHVGLWCSPGAVLSLCPAFKCALRLLHPLTGGMYSLRCVDYRSAKEEVDAEPVSFSQHNVKSSGRSIELSTLCLCFLQALFPPLRIKVYIPLFRGDIHAGADTSPW